MVRVERLEEPGQVYRPCLESVFFELDPPVRARLAPSDHRLEKEAWLLRTLMEFGCCGLSLVAEEPRATLLFCPPDIAPGATALPTAPVSPDALLLSSLHIDPVIEGVGLENVLIDAAILEAMKSPVNQALEAFGRREEDVPGAGIMTVETLQASGFEVVREHEKFPRLRLELPPQHDLMAWAAEEIWELSFARA